MSKCKQGLPRTTNNKIEAAKHFLIQSANIMSENKTCKIWQLFEFD
jgi:hypothetical protein